MGSSCCSKPMAAPSSPRTSRKHSGIASGVAIVDAKLATWKSMRQAQHLHPGSPSVLPAGSSPDRLRRQNAMPADGPSSPPMSVSGGVRSPNPLDRTANSSPPHVSAPTSPQLLSRQLLNADAIVSEVVTSARPPNMVLVSPSRDGGYLQVQSLALRSPAVTSAPPIMFSPQQHERSVTPVLRPGHVHDIPQWKFGADGGAGYESDVTTDSANQTLQPFQPLGGAMMDDWWERQLQNVVTAPSPAIATAAETTNHTHMDEALDSPARVAAYERTTLSSPPPRQSPTTVSAGLAIASPNRPMEFLPAAAVPSFTNPLATFLPHPYGEEDQEQNYHHHHHVEIYLSTLPDQYAVSSVDGGAFDNPQNQHDDDYAILDDGSCAVMHLHQPQEHHSNASDIAEDDRHSSTSHHRRNATAVTVAAPSPAVTATTTTTSSSKQYPIPRPLHASSHSSPSFDMESIGRCPVESGTSSSFRGTANAVVAAQTGDVDSPRRGSLHHRSSVSTTHSQQTSSGRQLSSFPIL